MLQFGIIPTSEFLYCTFFLFILIFLGIDLSV